MANYGVEEYDVPFNWYSAYITKPQDNSASQNTQPQDSRPRAPDEGGTPFGGFGKGGYHQDVSKGNWWEKCPLGTHRSKIPPFKCKSDAYYGATGPQSNYPVAYGTVGGWFQQLPWPKLGAYTVVAIVGVISFKIIQKKFPKLFQIDKWM